MTNTGASRSSTLKVKGKRDGNVEGDLHYIEDNYTDPWQDVDTIVMLHGIAEQAEIWRAWVPGLSRRHRILRVDLRGFGASSPMPPGFGIADWADDIEQLIAALGRARVHLVATKLGALIAFELAQRHPQWIVSMTLAGMLPSPSKALGPWLDEWLAIIEGPGDGVLRWAEVTMPGRMGSSLSPAAMQWWADIMGTAPVASVAACVRLLPAIEEPSNPERVQCPTLFIVAGAPEAPQAASYGQRPAASDLQRLRERVAGSAWVEVPADSYHIAATHPDACAKETAAFIDQLDAT